METRHFLTIVLSCALTQRASAQRQHTEMQFGAGGAQVTGTGYERSGALGGWLGVEHVWDAVWGARFDVSALARVVTGSCIEPSPHCGHSVPGNIEAFMVGGTRRFATFGFASPLLEVGVEAGVAHVGSSTTAPSGAALATALTSQAVVLRVGDTRVVLGAQVMLIPNVAGHSLKVFPITLGLRF